MTVEQKIERIKWFRPVDDVFFEVLAKRVRYNASMITVKESDTGTDYSRIPEVYVVYISEFDIFEKNKTVYHIEKVIKETGDTIDDGLHEIFVNTKVHDGTEIAEFMKHFTETKFEDRRFPCFTSAVKAIKDTEGGRESMCKLMEEYSREEAIDATIRTALKFKVPTEQIVQDLHDEYGLDSDTALKRIEDYQKNKNGITCGEKP